MSDRGVIRAGMGWIEDNDWRRGILNSFVHVYDDVIFMVIESQYKLKATFSSGESCDILIGNDGTLNSNLYRELNFILRRVFVNTSFDRYSRSYTTP